MTAAHADRRLLVRLDGGGEGSDTLTGTGGQSVQFGDGGNDIMTGSLDNSNYFAGGLGDDVMTGGNLIDYISDVDGGDDVMYGNSGNDTRFRQKLLVAGGGLEPPT